METSVLARARSGQRFGDGGADAGQTIGSQITPKTLLRCMNYGDSFTKLELYGIDTTLSSKSHSERQLH